MRDETMTRFLATLPVESRDDFERMAAQCWDPRTGVDGLKSLWATVESNHSED